MTDDLGVSYLNSRQATNDAALDDRFRRMVEPEVDTATAEQPAAIAKPEPEPARQVSANPAEAILDPEQVEGGVIDSIMSGAGTAVAETSKLVVRLCEVPASTK